MRKLFYLGMCAVLSMGVGCALTNYDLIVDNDQVSNGQGSGVVNTNGKAYVHNFKIGTIWPDGVDVQLWFVDQAANGDRTCTTYNDFSTLDEPWFPDDKYCSPDRQGCSLVTADDPQVGDVDIFDWKTLNFNCQGFRSLYYVVSSSRYYGECGRAMPITDRLSLLNQARLTSLNGQAALEWTLTPMNTSVTMNNLAGVQQFLPMAGSITITQLAGPSSARVIDLTNPMTKVLLNASADFVATYGSHANEVTLTFNGISISKQFGLLPNAGANARARANRY